MRIGEIARLSGLSAHTLRYYERIGLLPYADRDRSGQRDYDASILAWTEFLGRLKTTGMPIREMLRYAALRRQAFRAKPRAGSCSRPIASGCASMSPSSNPAFSSSTPRSPAMPTQSRGSKSMTHNQDLTQSRFERGKVALSRIDGKGGENVVAALADIAPDLARYLIEFPFGDIYSRPGLDLRGREIATIAALTALGHAAPQLKVYIAAGLNVGLSRDEIVETIMQMAVYAGFPAALNGLFAAKEVFAAHAEAGEAAGA
jgi:4-carboxymuconolactone decarboxylase